MDTCDGKCDLGYRDWLCGSPHSKNQGLLLRIVTSREARD